MSNGIMFAILVVTLIVLYALFNGELPYRPMMPPDLPPGHKNGKRTHLNKPKD